MTIVITQQDSEFASRRVSICVNRELVGAVGPGESLTVKNDADYCEVDAYCGTHHTWHKLYHDEHLLIRWIPSAERMEIAPVKG